MGVVVPNPGNVVVCNCGRWCAWQVAAGRAGWWGPCHGKGQQCCKNPDNQVKKVVVVVCKLLAGGCKAQKCNKGKINVARQGKVGRKKVGIRGWVVVQSLKTKQKNRRRQ